MIAHAGLSNIFWAEAISAAAYVRNRLPTAALKERETPYERWYGRKPDVSHFRVFGCMAYAHVPDCERRKLDTKSKKMRFVGYSLTLKGYCLIDETNQKLYVRRDVEFNESDFGQKSAMTTRVRTGPGKPGKSWNFVLPFSRTGKSWKMATGPGKSWKS